MEGEEGLAALMEKLGMIGGDAKAEAMNNELADTGSDSKGDSKGDRISSK